MTRPSDNLEARAARLGAKEHEWNELDFVGWKEFRRMAPAVIGLEMARLERIMAACEPGADSYNTLVRARHELRQFADGLAEAEKEEIDVRGGHLARALLAVSMMSDQVESLDYVAYRLQYIHQRLQLIY